MAIIIQLRRDTAANWTSVDPTLANGEAGYETDTGKVKIGDGSTAWTSLSYFGGGGGTTLELFKELANSPSITTPTTDNEVNIGEDDVIHLTADGSIGINDQDPRSKYPNGMTASTVSKLMTILPSASTGHTGLIISRVDKLTGMVLFAKNNSGDTYIDHNFNGSTSSMSFRVGTLGSGAGTTVLQLFGNGEIGLPNIPTSAPATAGRLWNDSGTIKIS